PFREILSPAPGAKNNSAPPPDQCVRVARLISQESQLSWRGQGCSSQGCSKMRDSSTSLGMTKRKPAFMAYVAMLNRYKAKSSLPIQRFRDSTFCTVGGTSTVNISTRR